MAAGRHEVHLAGGEVGDVRLVGEADAVALLRLLPSALEPKRVRVVNERKVNFEMVGPRQREAQFFGVAADLVIVHRQAAAEDDVVHAVQRRPAKAVPLGQGGQRRGGGVGRDAEDDVVAGINLALEAHFPAVRRDGAVRQVEVAAAGFLVGEKLASNQAKLGHHAVVQRLVKRVMRVALDGESLVAEERPAIGQAEFGQVDENADTLARSGAERVAQQASETERGEMW